MKEHTNHKQNDYHIRLPGQYEFESWIRHCLVHFLNIFIKRVREPSCTCFLCTRRFFLKNILTYVFCLCVGLRGSSKHTIRTITSQWENALYINSSLRQCETLFHPRPYNYYHPRMWVGNVFSHVCVSLCFCLFRL